MKFIVLMCVLLLCAPMSIFASGFVTHTMWYEPETFFAGDVARIYAAVLNVYDGTLTGSVEFSDERGLIGKSNFVLEEKGDIGTVSVDWKAREGTTHIRAKIIETGLSHDGSKEGVTLRNISAELEIKDIVPDTDGDLKGDPEDEDDDNDGLTDDEEKKQGTSPLLTDTDHDSIPDREEHSNVNREGETRLDGAGEIAKRAVAVTESFLTSKKSDLDKKSKARKDTQILKDFSRRIVDFGTSSSSDSVPTVFGAMRSLGAIAGRGSLAALLFVLGNTYLMIAACVIVGFVGIRFIFRRRNE